MTENYYLSSYPRSGNTMVRLLLLRYFGFSVPSAYGVEPPLNGSLTERLNAQSGEAPVVFWKTHAVQGRFPLRGLLVVRDGRDALVSYAHYLQEVAGLAGQSFEGRLLSLCDSYEWSYFNAFWASQDEVLVVKYEHLCCGEVQAVRLLRKALTALLGREVACGSPHDLPFADLHRENPRFFRKGVAGSWRQEMPPAIEAVFWSRHADVMDALGYTR